VDPYCGSPTMTSERDREKGKCKRNCWRGLDNNSLVSFIFLLHPFLV